MTDPVLELVQRPDMVDVDVGGDAQHRLAAGRAEGRAQRPQSHAGIDDEVGVAADDIPDIGPEEGVDMRFPQPPDAGSHHLLFEPAE